MPPVTSRPPKRAVRPRAGPLGVPYILEQGLSPAEVAVEYPLPLWDGRIVLRLPGRPGPEPTEPIDPCDDWQLLHIARNLGLPSNFFDPALTSERLMRELPVERPGQYSSWVPDPPQRALMRNLFAVRTESVRAADVIRQELDRLIAEARQRIARLPVTFDVVQPNPHPQRARGAGVLNFDLASPEQMRAW